MRADCDVCRGRGTIRLPIHRPVSAVLRVFDAVPSVAEESSRDYPCPECADTVPTSRIAVARLESTAAAYIEDADFVAYCKRGLALQFADYLLKHDYIQFERGRTNEHYMTFEMRAALGVVSPRHVATIEERVKEQQTKIAGTWAALAKLKIDSWGAYYGSTDITKTQACRLIDEAAKRATTETWKEMS